MTDCTQGSFGFPACRKRSVEVDFSGGAVSSNGGVLLLRAADRRLGLSAAAAGVLRDPRAPGRCRHSALAQLRQRLYGLALGYEDLNDHEELRHDLPLQTAVDRVAHKVERPELNEEPFASCLERPSPDHSSHVRDRVPPSPELC